ncbi:MAG: hypothetical protein OXF48_03060, partial [Bacteroidetes bacterium]|nr:hypothetical protein [Bacteroidota bacterium]
MEISLEYQFYQFKHRPEQKQCHNPGHENSASGLPWKLIAAVWAFPQSTLNFQSTGRAFFQFSQTRLS